MAKGLNIIMTTIVKLMENKPENLITEEDIILWNEIANYLQNKQPLKSASQIISYIDEAFISLTGFPLKAYNASAVWQNIPKNLIQKYYLTSF